MLYRLVYSVLQFLKQHPNFIRLSILAVIILAITPIVIAKIYQHLDRDPDRGAIALKDGAFDESYSTPQYLKQGWSRADSLWFYTTTQGSALLPYDFFLALERANSKKLFKSKENIDRFRYLPQKETYFNPDALPVGFAKESYKGKDYVGFTCAACHTGQINYKGKALRIDGGPAMADMVRFLTELQEAMEATQLDQEKHGRFVKTVQERNNSYYRKPEDIDKDLKKWTETIRLYNIVNESYELSPNFGDGRD